MSIDQIVDAVLKLDSEKRKRVRANAMKKLQSGNEKERNDAQKVLDALDHDEARHRAEFVSASAPEQVNMIFGLSPLTETERNILSVVLENPSSTSAELSEICGFKRGGGWHLQFGTMCKERLANLIEPPASSERVGEDFYTGILAHFESNDRSFKIKPEFEDSIRALLSRNI